jgi:glycosyltransferase involved in cell wall biosynthesis
LQPESSSHDAASVRSQQPIQVLYILHTGAFSGASVSLEELLRGFSQGAVVAHVLVPSGRAGDLIAATGADVLKVAGLSQFDNTRYGRYRGRRWLLLLRELIYLPVTAFALIRARRHWPAIELIHVNEITALPAAALAKLLFRVPLVMHVRSVQHPCVASLRGRIARWILHKVADAIIAIDETVRNSLSADLPSEVVHNGFRPRFREGDDSRRRFGDEDAPPGMKLRVGLVGNLHPMKGVSDFLEAARICRERGTPAEFVLAGASPKTFKGLRARLLWLLGFDYDIEAEVRRYIELHGLSEMVRLRGFTTDIADVYRNLDVLCFPSRLGAVGRPVQEAAHWRNPSIVAVSNPPPDLMLDGITGFTVAAGDPRAIADTIAHFCENPGKLRRMGDAARELARNTFDIARNAEQVLQIYRRLLDSDKSGAPVARSSPEGH